MPSPALACSYVWLVLLFLILHQGLYHSLLCHNIRLIFSLLLPAWLLYVTELDSLAVVWGLKNKTNVIGFVSTKKTSSVLQDSDFTCRLPKIGATWYFGLVILCFSDDCF